MYWRDALIYIHVGGTLLCMQVYVLEGRSCTCTGGILLYVHCIVDYFFIAQEKKQLSHGCTRASHQRFATAITAAVAMSSRLRARSSESWSIRCKKALHKVSKVSESCKAHVNCMIMSSASHEWNSKRWCSSASKIMTRNHPTLPKDRPMGAIWIYAQYRTWVHIAAHAHKEKRLCGKNVAGDLRRKI